MASQVAEFGRNRREIGPRLDQHDQQVYIRTYTGINPILILSAVY